GSCASIGDSCDPVRTQPQLSKHANSITVESGLDAARFPLNIGRLLDFRANPRTDFGSGFSPTRSPSPSVMRYHRHLWTARHSRFFRKSLRPHGDRTILIRLLQYMSVPQKEE